jgi:formyl-CoA transferase
MSELLSGIRVLDLSNVLAGPFCAYQLALQGADVIKVESPHGGDLARQLGADTALNLDLMGASFLAQNANKRSVVLDLKNEHDRSSFKALVATADVVLENFRPGVMKRLGLDHTVLRAINPELIYCAISGFGQEGPLSHAPAYDQIIQGMSGAMSITGSADSAPLRVGYPACDTIGGMTAAFAVCAALVRRLTSGEGATIDLSMLDSTIVSMGWVVSNLLVADSKPVPMGNDNFTASPSGTFATADSPINIAANKQEQFEALCRVIGAEELIADGRFAAREARKLNRYALNAAIEIRLKRSGAAKWVERLNAAGVPCGPVLSVDEALHQAQVRQRGLVTELPAGLPTHTSVRVTGAGFHVDGRPVTPHLPPPRLGAHTDAILRELDLAQPSGAVR